MSRHSRHNTHLAYFTNHERSQLKSYGTQRRRLNQNSYREFDHCHLCISKTISPVACPKGDLFCRQCALENILAQKEEIKEIQAQQARSELSAAQQSLRDDQAASAQQISEFESIQAGMRHSGSLQMSVSTKPDTTDRPVLLLMDAPSGPTSKKRRFEVDEDEVERIAAAELASHKKVLQLAKPSAKGTSSAFWLPEEVPDALKHDHAKLKTTPICPASEDAYPHTLSLKSLIEVKFEEDQEKSIRVCPACKKQLSNVTGGSLLINCGHVVCKACMDRFVRDEGRCCTCSKPFTPSSVNKKTKIKNESGYIELREEGTGFSSKKNALVTKKGTAFQG